MRFHVWKQILYQANYLKYSAFANLNSVKYADIIKKKKTYEKTPIYTIRYYQKGQYEMQSYKLFYKYKYILCSIALIAIFSNIPNVHTI